MLKEFDFRLLTGILIPAVASLVRGSAILRQKPHWKLQAYSTASLEPQNTSLRPSANCVVGRGDPSIIDIGLFPPTV